MDVNGKKHTIRIAYLNMVSIFERSWCERERYHRKNKE
jgi:hypothetical protein